MKPVERYTNEEILLAGIRACCGSFGTDYDTAIAEFTRAGTAIVLSAQNRLLANLAEKMVTMNADLTHVQITRVRNEVQQLAREGVEASNN